MANYGGKQCNMGMGSLASPSARYKRKFRWMFGVISQNVFGEPAEGVRALPPTKGSRPSLEFKDIEVQHVTEDIYLPGKPSWKPINITLYDMYDKNCWPSNPVWDWIKQCYDPETGEFFAILDNKVNGYGFKKDCWLKLFSGCGDVMESWVFENAYPSQVNWGDLDMSSSEVLTIELTLRYDRASLCPWCHSPYMRQEFKRSFDKI